MATAGEARPAMPGYRLQAMAGQGSVGRVWRAYSPELGGDVAIKELAIDARSSERRQGLIEEFRTLSGLQHSNIVRVLDFGFAGADNSPFLVLDLLEDAATVVDRAVEVSTTRRLQWLQDLLEALRYLHGQGVVHSDLKPGNVLVTGDELRVVDFGVAALDERTDRIAGTLAYMDPQTLLGRSPEPGSDLYGAGCLAVEMLLGRRVFPELELTADRVLGPYADETLDGPIASMLLPSVDEVAWLWDLTDDDAAKLGALAPFVRRLCAPDPARRFGSATEALRELSKHTGHALSLRSDESLVTASRLVGRQRELEELHAGVQRARDGDSSLFLIGAVSGCGKSRLLTEVWSYALANGCYVARGQARREAQEPLHLWGEVVLSLACRVELDPATASMLAHVFPILAERLGWTPRNEGLPAKQVIGRVASAIREACRRSDRPVLVLLDDLQWADGASLDLLAALAKDLDGVPLCVAANYRDDEADYRGRFEGAREMKLGNLTETQIRLLAGRVLHPDIAAEVGELSFRESGGNPFLAVELLLGLAERAKGLDAVDLGTVADLGGVDALLAERVQRIDGELQELTALAAVHGRVVDLEVLGEMTDSERVQAWLGQGAAHRVLERVKDTWRFAHDKIREAVLSRLADKERVAAHARLAAALESLRPEAHAALAHHYAGANDGPGECRHAAAAGEQAAAAGSYREAESYLLRAAELSDTTAPRLQLALASVYMATRGFGSDQADAAYERAQEICDAAGDPARGFQARWGRWLVRLSRGDVPGSTDLGLDVLERARTYAHPNAEVQAHHALWTSRFYEPDHGAVLGHTSAVIDRWEDAPPRREHDEVFRNEMFYGGHSPLMCAHKYRSLSLYYTGRAAEALRTVEDGIAVAGDVPGSRLNIIGYHGMIHAFRGRFAEAEATCREAISMSRTYGFPFFGHVAMGTLSWVLARLDRLDEAVEIGRAALEGQRRIGSLMDNTWIGRCLVEAHLARDELGEALQVIEEAIRLSAQTGETFMLPELNRQLGVIARLRPSLLPEGPVAYLERAIEHAARQRAVALELRGWTALHELRPDAASRAALQRLSDAHEPGADTPELNAAKEALSRLAGDS